MADSRANTSEDQSIELNNFKLLFEDFKNQIDSAVSSYESHRKNLPGKANLQTGFTREEKIALLSQLIPANNDTKQANLINEQITLLKNYDVFAKKSAEEKGEIKKEFNNLIKTYSLDVLENKNNFVNKNLFLFSLKNDLQKCAQSYLKNGNSKEMLETYWEDVKAIISRADTIYTNKFEAADKSRWYQSETKKLLQALHATCDTYQPLFKKAEDIKIYRANIPEGEFKQLNEHAKTFFYEGRGTAIKRIAGESLTYMAAPVVGVGIVGAALVSTAFTHTDMGMTNLPGEKNTLREKNSPIDQKEQSKTIKDKLSLGFFSSRTLESVQRFGHVTNGKISPDWIEGEVQVVKQNKKTSASIENENANYIKSSKSSTVYILDGGSRDEVFQNGINSNQNGQTVYFKDVNDAVLMLLSNLKSKENRYTADQGWNMESTKSKIEPR
ncbi:MAG: hypothetical protein A3F13_09485 [Gammaproteobacteria bacterium RIFCSPHIGHO2_12_FULL_40_19]|nr:MAG: hypothetical protein A3F13_09485 [Gammaproteobacteria bacterium RIFCSPHIGHO2_12_FULL_40_19]